MKCEECVYWQNRMCTDEADFSNRDGEPVCRYNPAVVDQASDTIKMLRSEITRLTTEIEAARKVVKTTITRQHCVCGERVKVRHNFCPSCGAKIIWR